MSTTRCDHLQQGGAATGEVCQGAQGLEVADGGYEGESVSIDSAPVASGEGSGRGALCLDGLDFFELVDEVQKRLAIDLELF